MHVYKKINFGGDKWETMLVVCRLRWFIMPYKHDLTRPPISLSIFVVRAGPIPSELTKLVALEELCLHHNQLEGDC